MVLTHLQFRILEISHWSIYSIYFPAWFSSTVDWQLADPQIGIPPTKGWKKVPIFAETHHLVTKQTPIPPACRYAIYEMIRSEGTENSMTSISSRTWMTIQPKKHQFFIGKSTPYDHYWIIFLWVKQCHKPPIFLGMVRNGLYHL